MVSISILPEDPYLIELLASMQNMNSTKSMPNTTKSLNQVSNMIATAWGSKVDRKKIKIDKSSPTSRKVYSQDKLVHWLENGLPGYDMRYTHTKGQKSRVVKPRIGPGGKVVTSWKVKNPDGTYRTVMAGSSYLIVPFFHKKSQGKGSEQKTIADHYNSVRGQINTEGFKRSSVVTSQAESSKTSLNYWGEQVKRAEYDWGNRLEFPDTPENQNLQGMVAMVQDSGKKRQSGYMTFRVVSVNSPAGSWWNPGIKARHYLENILNEGRETITQIIQDGLRKDLG